MSISSHLGIVILVIVGAVTVLGVIIAAIIETRRMDREKLPVPQHRPQAAGIARVHASASIPLRPDILLTLPPQLYPSPGGPKRRFQSQKVFIAILWCRSPEEILPKRRSPLSEMP